MFPERASRMHLRLRITDLSSILLHAVSCHPKVHGGPHKHRMQAVALPQSCPLATDTPKHKPDAHKMRRRKISCIVCSCFILWCLAGAKKSLKPGWLGVCYKVYLWDRSKLKSIARNHLGLRECLRQVFTKQVSCQNQLEC